MDDLSAEGPLTCPYCGEPVEVVADEVGPESEEYVEDCPVCCRPWQVTVTRDEAGVHVSLRREDE